MPKLCLPVPPIYLERNPLFCACGLEVQNMMWSACRGFWETMFAFQNMVQELTGITKRKFLPLGGNFWTKSVLINKKLDKKQTPLADLKAFLFFLLRVSSHAHLH